MRLWAWLVGRSGWDIFMTVLVFVLWNISTTQILTGSATGLDWLILFLAPVSFGLDYWAWQQKWQKTPDPA